MNGTFKFPKSVKYPSIPIYIDKTSTVYPLSESSFLTGPEYILAKRQGCTFDVKSAFYIYPKEKKVAEDKVELIKPFYNIIKEIKNLRRVHNKGTFNNLIYKETGNSIYGNVVRGMSDKKSYDTLTGKTFRITGT